jgi:hypothetical protein
MRILSLVLLAGLLGGGVWLAAPGAAGQPAEKPATAKTTAPAKSESAAEPKGEGTDDEPSDDAVREIISGKVVPLWDALKRRGVKSYPEEAKGQFVLVTESGELVPFVADWRGRAFYQDERLRGRPVDLVVNRRPGVPWVQVLSIYAFDEQGTRNVVDYWCDICAIPMYEIKDCECCQGPTRLRFRPQELPADVGRHGAAGAAAKKKSD